MHALEIAAGMNFRQAWLDLHARGELGPDLGRDLIEAQHQEMAHARIVRKMLRVLGEGMSAELMDMPMPFVYLVPECLPEPWPEGMDAYAGICINHSLEQYFAGGGVGQFYLNMVRALKHLPADDRVPFITLAGDFYKTVAKDEAWHVLIDEAVMQLYARIHNNFDMTGLLAKMHVTRSPFIHVIKARQAFLRCL